MTAPGIDPDLRALPIGAADLEGVSEALLVLAPALAPAAYGLAARHPTTRFRVLLTDVLPSDVLSTDMAATDRVPTNLTLTVCRTIGERVEAAIRSPRPELIVESGNHRKGQKWACFRELFLFLSEGGRYIVDRVSAVDDPTLDDRPGETVIEFVERLSTRADDIPIAERGLAEAIGSTGRVGDTLVIGKRRRHLVKLRDAAATAVLQERYGSAWGEQVASRPAYSFASRASVTAYGSGPAIGAERVNVPQLALRRYDGALVGNRQRITYGDYYLPDTFRHHRARRLAHHMLGNASATLDAPNNPAPPRVEQLSGDYFYFDAEYPGHFGHVTTEVLSRFWGWVEARRRAPDLRVLVSAGKDGSDIPQYQRVLFEALGIPLEQRYVIPAATAVEVEHLWAATPGFSMPHYADRALAGVWETVARKLSPELGRPVNDRLFVSRRGGWRPCHNQDEVEAFFADQGFDIFFPGDHPIDEQVLRFRSARVLAGFGGSSMFGTMFAPGSARILINGDTNTASNEFLIAAVVGAPLHYFWSPADLRHPPGGWDVEAFHAGFTFELDRHGPALRSLIDRYGNH